MAHGHYATSANMKAEATPLAPTKNQHCLTGFYQCPSRPSSLEATLLNRCKAQPSPPTEQQPMHKAAAQINSIPGIARHWPNTRLPLGTQKLSSPWLCWGVDTDWLKDHRNSFGNSTLLCTGEAAGKKHPSPGTTSAAHLQFSAHSQTTCQSWK